MSSREESKDNEKSSVPPKKARPSERLFAATKEGNYSEIKALLKEKVNVNYRCKLHGNAALHSACSGKHFDIVKVLLENKAKVNITNDDDATPLHKAASSGQYDIVSLLIQSGAKLDKRNSKGWTPLRYACCGNHVDVVKLLLDNHAEVDTKCNNLNTPLQAVSVCTDNENSTLDIIKYLLHKGARIDWKCRDGSTALHGACCSGVFRIVELLLVHNPSVDIQDSKGYTPLHVACKQGHLDIVKLLVKNGAKTNIKGSDGKTPGDISCCSQITEYLSNAPNITASKATANTAEKLILTLPDLHDGKQDTIINCKEKRKECTPCDTMCSKDADHNETTGNHTSAVAEVHNMAQKRHKGVNGLINGLDARKQESEECKLLSGKEFGEKKKKEDSKRRTQLDNDHNDIINNLQLKKMVVERYTKLLLKEIKKNCKLQVDNDNLRRENCNLRRELQLKQLENERTRKDIYDQNN